MMPPFGFPVYSGSQFVNAAAPRLQAIAMDFDPIVQLAGKRDGGRSTQTAEAAIHFAAME